MVSLKAVAKTVINAMRRVIEQVAGSDLSYNWFVHAWTGPAGLSARVSITVDYVCVSVAPGM